MSTPSYNGPVTLPPDLRALDEAFAAAGADARALVEGLGERGGTWQPVPGSWSVAECLDHLAVGHRVYLTAMEPAASRARETGRLRRGPSTPGLIGGWFARSLEPPVTRRVRAPRKIVPRPSPSLADAADAFFTAHEQVVQFVRAYGDIDLAGVRFRNPFIPIVHFSLASGLHVLAAHERRHLWQAWNVRRATPIAGP